jgi:hypothetical protein
MTGDARVRYCAGCQKHVYDLSAMTQSEAERLVCDAAGQLCVRFSRAPDGRVQTLDYQPPAGRRRGWRFWTIVSTCAASLVAGANGYLLGRGKPTPPAVGVFVGEPAMPATALPASPSTMPTFLGMMAPPPLPPAAVPQSPAPPVG